jgi:hypothetical protein
LYGDIAVRLLSGSFFEPPSNAISRSQSPGSDPVVRPEAELDFSTYSGFGANSLARALVDAFLAANLGCQKAPQFQPTAEQVFSAVDAGLRRPIFDGNRTAYEEAERRGVSLRFGVLLDQPQVQGARETLVSGCWFERGGLTQTTFVSPGTVVEEALTALRNMRGELLRPPYFALVLIEPGGHVRRLWLQGIWSDGTHFCPVKSDFERSAAAELNELGSVFFKPLLRTDIPLLSEGLGLTSELPEGWRYTPDFISWKPASRTPGIANLQELRGYRPDKGPPGYSDHLDKKGLYFRRLGAGWTYSEILGWRLPAAPQPPREPEDWKSPPVSGGLLSEAAQAHIAQILQW